MGGLRRALAVLIELLAMLRSMGILEGILQKTIPVEILDLAQFTKQVKQPSIFESVASHLKVETTQLIVAPAPPPPGAPIPRLDPQVELEVKVHRKHWQCVHQAVWKEEPLTDMSRALHRVDRRTG